MTVKVCAVEECDRQVVARGYCLMHWKRWRAHGDPLFVRQRKQCEAPGCAQPARRKGYCPTHYWRMANKGSASWERTPLTHCKNGHEYTPENTYRHKDGGRSCKACRRDGYRQWCKQNREHANEYARKRRERPEVQQYQRDYARRRRIENPWAVRDAIAKRDARLRGAQTEPVNRLDVYYRDSGICHICREAVPLEGFTLDHLIPISKGGPHCPSNVAVAHRSCNSRRYDGRIPAQLLLFG